MGHVFEQCGISGCISLIWCFEVSSSFDSQMHTPQPPGFEMRCFCLDWVTTWRSLLHGCGCQNECQSSLNWLFAGLMTIQGPEGTEGWGMPEDAGFLVGSCCKLLKMNSLYTRLFIFGTAWCMLIFEDLWTSELQQYPSAPWLPLGLLNIVFLCFSSPCCFGKSVFHGDIFGIHPPRFNQVEEHSFFQRMWSWVSETANPGCLWILRMRYRKFQLYIFTSCSWCIYTVFMYHDCSYLYTYEIIYTYIYIILFVYICIYIYSSCWPRNHLTSARVEDKEVCQACNVECKHKDFLFFPTKKATDIRGGEIRPEGLGFQSTWHVWAAGCCVNKWPVV